MCKSVCRCVSGQRAECERKFHPRDTQFHTFTDARTHFKRHSRTAINTLTGQCDRGSVGGQPEYERK